MGSGGQNQGEFAGLRDDPGAELRVGTAEKRAARGADLDATRSRVLVSGTDAVTDAELLALWLGLPDRESATALCRQQGGAETLLRAPAGTLLATPGLGRIRASRLLAAVALVERASEAALRAGPELSSSREVRRFLRLKLAHQPREIFACLFLDNRHRLIRFEALFHGTVDRASVHPREVLRRALELNAAAVILAHNHPSGVAEPSASDLALTRDLADLLRRVDVRVLDHLVVGQGSEVSFAERGFLDP